MDRATYFIGFLIIINFTCANSSDCNRRDTCSVNKNSKVPICYCDMDCRHFKDCCREYLSGKDNDHEQHNITRQNCVLLTTEKFLITERVGAFMIDQCYETSEQCMFNDSAFKSMVPVSTAEYTYLNDECALCNGVSNFRYWKAVFGDTDQNALFQMSRENISDRKIKELLSNETSKHSQNMVFHPPTGFRPRFCPYDALLAKTNVSSRHQNPLSCNYIYYKNLEECTAFGCCTPNDYVWCIRYDLKYFGQDDTRRVGDFGVRVILDFFKFDSSTADQLQQTTRMKESMSFIDMMVHMIFEVRDETNGSKILPTGFDDCIQGLLLLYRSNPYYLLSTRDTYNTAYLGNGTHVTLHQLQSQASLDVRMMDTLLHQDISFICHTKGETKLIGNIKVVEAAYVQEFFDFHDEDVYNTKQSVIISLNRYIIKDPYVVENCDNMSLEFEEKASKTIVSIKCDDDAEIGDKINGGKLPGMSFPILTITLVFLLGQ